MIWIADGELDALDHAARAYRQIIGAPDAPPPDESAPSAGPATDAADAGQPGPSDDRAGDRSPSAESLGEALEQAIAQARDGQLEQLNADIDLQQVLDRAADCTEPGSPSRGLGTGLPTGRMPDRGVDRPPAPDEVQHARRYATRLRQALTHGTRRIDKRTPGGRFDGRAYTRGRAQRATGRPVTAHPWRVTRQVTAPIQEPHVGRDHRHLRLDGRLRVRARADRMDPHRRTRQVGGRCATALFGNSAALLADGAQPLPTVPGISTGGGTAFAGDAIELVCEHLEMSNPRRPRFVYVLSDGGWADTQAGVAEDPLARRARRPDHPPEHRDRPAVGRMRPHRA